MSEKAYVVVEGTTDVMVVRAVLPPELLADVSLAPAGGRSNIASIARSILVTRRKPVAVLVDTDSVDERIIQDRMQNTQELLKAVAGGVPTRLILLIPSIEAVFFASGVLPAIYGNPLPEEVRVMARSSPKEALLRLFTHPAGPKNLDALLDSLGDEGIAAIRATPPIRELIAFLEKVMNPQAKHSIV
jgi:hypothetical protein